MGTPIGDSRDISLHSDGIVLSDYYRLRVIPDPGHPGFWKSRLGPRGDIYICLNGRALWVLM